MSKRYFNFLFICVICFTKILPANELDNPSAIVKKHIETVMSELDVPGVAVALCFKGQTFLYQFGYADRTLQIPITQNTIFELASITKVFTSTALALEVLAGKMALDDPVAKYIPQLSNSKNPISQIKLVDLATHTSSLPRMPPNHREKRTPQQLIAFLRNWSPAYPIASKYVYSNFAFALLGFAISQVEQENYDTVIHKLITEPLGMSSTGVHIPSSLLGHYAQGYAKNSKPAKRYHTPTWPGGGAIRSTSSDMLKFLEANLNLLGPLEMLKAMQFAQKSYFKVKSNFEMGLGWQRFQTEDNLLIIDKNGGLEGFSSYIGMIPAQKLGIVILMNKAKAHSTRLGRKILLALAKEP